MRHLAAILLVPPLLALTSTPAQAAGTCQGQTATVESSGGTVTGTEGDDVIVVTGPADVNALGGNDVICVAGGTLAAGPGDDRVEATGGQSAGLGPGDDRYTSTGHAWDTVDVSAGDSAGTDTISTGGGMDQVSSGVLGEANADVIDLGADSDYLSLVLPAGSNVTAAGGPAGLGGENYLTTTAAPDDAAPWSVQLPGEFSRAGVSLGTFSGFSSQSLVMKFGPTTPVTVRGTPGEDRLSLTGGLPDIDLAGDRDILSLYGLPDRGRIVGGSGKYDLVSVSSESELRVDSGRRQLGQLEMHGFEVFALEALVIHFRGSKRVDSVVAIGCTVSLRGGPGNDLLSYANEDQRSTVPSCAEHRFRMYGGSGNDSLHGWRGRDRLIGGPGRDEANGKQRRDVCQAEIERNCEA